MLAFTVALAASPDEISRALGTCTAARQPLPPIGAPDLRRLADGEVVKIVHHADDPGAASSAVGIAVLNADREALWLAFQDLHAEVDPSLTEFPFGELGPDRHLWYGHLDLPRPLADRQWVVESGNSRAMAPTGCWEHYWTLVPDGLALIRPSIERGERKVTVEQLDDAIVTPTNDGSWLLVPLEDGRTVVSYQARTVIGGSIPSWLVLQLSLARLESVLRALEGRAVSWVPGHYGAGHEDVMGGDGRPIARRQ